MPNPAHPTGAALCAKGRAAPELVGSPRRLTRPLKRTRPRHEADAGWIEIGWEEALDTIAERLGEVRARAGAEAVAFAVTTPSGTPMVDSFEWVERFVRVFGSPNVIYAVEVCGWHKDYAHALTFGRGIGSADYDAADTIVLWGHNPARTWLAQAVRVAAAKRRGATIVVVDPKRGGSGEDADLWLSIRPGTDAALAMGAIRHLLVHRTFDHDFVRHWSNGSLLVDRETGRFIRAGELWREGGAETFVVLGPDGSPRPEDTQVQPKASGDAQLSGEIDLVGWDGHRIRAATAFTQLAETAATYTPERVAAITGLPAADLARFFALFEGSPRLAYHSWTGVGQHTNATQTERAIATLYALTGATDRRGGNLWTVTPPARSVNDYGLLPRAQQDKALGLGELPLGPPARGWVTARDVCRAIQTGEPYRVEALMSFGSNFVTSQADSSRNREALRALDFHVHVDMFMNPTAENADIVLPASMPWEREALKVGFEITQAACEHIQLRQAMVPVAGEARADYEIVFALAERLGHRDAFFGGSIEAGWNHQLEPTGLTVADLRARPEGIRVPQATRERAYAAVGPDGKATGFATPTRRVELYSERLLAHGYPPLPGWIETAGGADGDFPLHLSTAKSGWFIHSSHRHVASLRRKSPEPSVDISPALAIAREIREGDWTIVSTAYGRASLRARLDGHLNDDVVIAEFGWWEDCPPVGQERRPAVGRTTSNINDALSDRHRDPVSGSIPLRAVGCDIRPDVVANRGRWSGQRPFRVSALRVESQDTLAITLRPDDDGPLTPFLPGQHVTIALGAGMPTRAYSLTRWSADPSTYEIAVRRITPQEDGAPAGQVSNRIHALALGSRVSLDPPRGTFTPPLFGSRPVLLIAAGIGITPFVGYLDALAARPGAERPPGIHLLFVCRNGQEHPFGRHLRDFAPSIPELTAVHVFTRPARYDVIGRDYDVFGRSALFGLKLPFSGRRPLAYICGPSSFVDDAVAMLIASGLPRFDIFSEVFTSAVDIPADLVPRTVSLGRNGRAFEWRPSAGTLLDAADAAGVPLPSGCRTGQCESCSVKISSGRVAHLSLYEGPPDHCLACRAVPLSDVVIDL